MKSTKNVVEVAGWINEEIAMYQEAYKKLDKFIKKELLLKYIMSVGMDKFKKERVSLEQTAKNLLINKLN
jgi:hypothetical protein